MKDGEQKIDFTVAASNKKLGVRTILYYSCSPTLIETGCRSSVASRPPIP